MNRKLALLAATAIVSGLLAAPAFADVNVRADITKDKDTFVNVSVSITKDIDINVDLTDVTSQGLGEAEAFVNADTSNNIVNLENLNGEVDDGEIVETFTSRLATMADAVNDNLGVIIQFNQDVGDNVNQGNVVSIAFVDVADDPGTPDDLEFATTHSEAAVSQRSANNQVRFDGEFPGFGINPRAADDDTFHVRAEIANVLERNNGVIMGNQNAGQNSNQHNAMALAVGVDSALALAEGDLGQEVTGNNRTFDSASFKRAQIFSSINENTGVTAFNQNTGHNNNQGTVISIAATGAAGGLVPGN